MASIMKACRAGSDLFPPRGRGLEHASLYQQGLVGTGNRRLSGIWQLVPRFDGLVGRFVDYREHRAGLPVVPDADPARC